MESNDTKYIVIFCSEFNSLQIFNHFCYVNPNIVIISPKKFAPIFTYAKEVLILQDSFYDQKTTELTTKGGINMFTIYEQEVDKAILQYPFLKKNEIKIGQQILHILINEPATIYRNLFNKHADMLLNPEYKFIQPSHNKKEKYVVISGRNLQKQNGTSNYNFNFKLLIEYLIEKGYHVKNITTNSPQFNYGEFYEEIDCTSNYQLQVDIMANAKLNIILGIAASPNIHLCVAGDFLVLMFDEHGYFFLNKDIIGEHINICDARKTHTKYITEVSYCKDFKTGKEHYDYKLIDSLLNHISLSENSSSYEPI